MSKPHLVPMRRFLSSNYFKPAFILPVSDDDNVARSGETALDLDQEASSAHVSDNCRFQECGPLIHSAKSSLRVKLNARFQTMSHVFPTASFSFHRRRTMGL